MSSWCRGRALSRELREIILITNANLTAHTTGQAIRTASGNDGVDGERRSSEAQPWDPSCSDSRTLS